MPVVLFLSNNARFGNLLGTSVHNTPLPLAVAFLLFVALGELPGRVPVWRHTP